MRIFCSIFWSTMLSVKYFIVVLSCVKLCMSLTKVPCSYDDEDCLTKATRAVYHKIVAGRPGEVEASDPLNRDVIDLDLPNLNYVLYNATLIGMQKCSVRDVKVNPKEVFFFYQIWCPSLQVVSDYQIDGKLDGVIVEGVGTSKIDYKNYEILLKGYYGKHIDQAGDLHTNITNFKLEVSSEELTREFTGISFGDKTEGAGNTSIEENLSNLEKIIRKPLMHSFIRKYIKNLNEFLDIVPVKDIHYQMV